MAEDEDEEMRPLLLSGRSELAAAVERMDAETREGLRILAENGWYIEPTWFNGAETGLASLLVADRDEGDRILCDLIEGHRTVSLSDLCTTYPHRERFFRLAFQAHARGEYALSIPLLLTQADGICRERLDVQLHARQEGKMKLTAKLGHADELANLYLSPILEEHPVVWGESKRAGSSDVFNRHAILHGESLRFDTRANGCRAISYARYVGWVLSALWAR